MKLKKLFTFLFIVLLIGLTSFSLFDSVFLSSCIESIKSGADGTKYFLTDVSANSQLFALGRDSSGYVIASGELSGKRTARMSLNGSVMPDEVKPVELFAVDEKAAVVSAYSMPTGEEYRDLRIFYIDLEEKSCSPVTAFECKGETAQQRSGEVKISSFSKYEDKIAFVACINEKSEIYSFNIEEKTVLQIGAFESGDISDALVLGDGSVAFAQGDTLTFSSGEQPYTLKGAIFSRLEQAKDGFYCCNSAAGELLFYSLKEKNAEPFFSFVPYTDTFGNEIEGYPDAVSWCVDSSASVVLLGKSGDITVIAQGGEYSASSGVYRSRGQSAAAVVLFAAAVLIISYVVYYLFTEAKKMKMPLLLRKGLVLAAVIVTGLNALVNYALAAEYDGRVREYAFSSLGAAAVFAAESEKTQAALMPLEGSLGQFEFCVFNAGDGVFTVKQAGSSRLAAGSTCADPAINSEFGEGLSAAAANGTAFTTGYSEGRRVYRSFLMSSGGSVLVVSSDARSAVSEAEVSLGRLTDVLIVSAAVLWLIIMLMFAGVVKGVLRVSKGMDFLAASGFNVEVVQRSGDELEGLARSFNDMARQVRRAVDMTGNRNNSYLRFVPQQIINLLGKASVEDVDKQTFVSRKMATMMVWFGFGEDVYESRTKELFDNINMVIEKTAAIVSRNGGTVYNFTYDGYDAVFADDHELAVSTAVAIRQEVTALNKERAKNGESLITFRIALDNGEVMMGIVGDENRMMPTAISASLNTAKRLVSLCSKLDANILCTEGVASSAKEYNSRYVGKCRDGDSMIRVYEIFDGDSYGVRLAKQASLQRFSEGVLSFYSRNFSASKRIFIDIARQSSDDGATKFYLYLSDRFEKDAPDEISLDF